jgi:alkanesulfonate monooxygenase SsuD/methylene tetrahydromethanopterin reductase-like flavin-dependent oxidoreductase (luciferase family)
MFRCHGSGILSGQLGRRQCAAIVRSRSHAATRRLNVFCTVHVSLFHPLIAAKQLATADHIGQGRLVLNLVCGAIEDKLRSPAGRAFAIRHSDLHFDGVKLPEQSADRIAETRRRAREQGREIQVWTPVGIVCRPTRREADAYMHYLVDSADRAAIGNVIDILAKDTGARTDPEAVSRRNGEGLIERQIPGHWPGFATEAS